MAKQDWITAQEATDILSKNAGRLIPASYIRSLVRSGHVEAKSLDKRTRLYLRSDVEKYVVRPRDQGKGTGRKPEEAVA